MKYLVSLALATGLVMPPIASPQADQQPEAMPDLLYASWQTEYPYFIASDFVLTPAGDLNDELLHPASLSTLAKYFRLPEKGGCTKLVPSVPAYLVAPPARTTAFDNARTADLVLVAQVTGLRAGFRGSDAGTLVRLRPQELLKSSERLIEDSYYVFVPRGVVEVGDKRFCATTTDFPVLPTIGDAVVVFVSHRKAFTGNLLKIYDGKDVAVLGRDGRAHLSPLYAQGTSQERRQHLTEPEDFLTELRSALSGDGGASS